MSKRDPRYPVPQDVSLAPLMRLLLLAHRGADRVMTRFLEDKGLTTSQFDVLATLGDTAGMSFKELSAQSLVTGGTLTPVLKRMEAKGLVTRCKGVKDTRQTIVSLTPEGQRLYEETFLPAMDHIKAYEDQLTLDEQAELYRLLDKVQRLFD